MNCHHNRFSTRSIFGTLFAAAMLALAGCEQEQAEAPPEEQEQPQAEAPPEEVIPDSIVWQNDDMLPYYEIPHIPVSAEAYFAPDSFHLIAQTRDDDAVPGFRGRHGNLTYTYTIEGTELTRINDKGQDACSYFFPDQKRVIFTSTRDNLHLPVGNWSDEDEYPRGGELYVANIDGSDRRRLTHNEHYEAEVVVSPTGEWIAFGRNIDGRQDLWRIRPDGTDEQRITDTDDWQEGSPYFLPDGENLLFRSWRDSEYKKIRPTPMTVMTINIDGSNWRRYTFDRDMNWAPNPAPDGRHYVFVRISETIDGRDNWDLYLGDLAGGEPVRLTTYPGFDGLPGMAPNGKLLAWARAKGQRFMQGIRTHIMDVSSFDLGPEHRQPLDPEWGEAMHDDP
jgi:Tol biopolymer transport system component